MFLLLHEDLHGKPLADHSFINAAVVAAELAALVVDDELGVEGDKLVRIAHRDRRRALESLDALVANTVEGEAPHTIAWWVARLSPPVMMQVTSDLLAEGVVTFRRRRLWGTDRYPAKDLLAACGPRIRLQHLVRHPEDFDQVGAAAALMVNVLGASRRVFEGDLDRAVFRRLSAGLPISLRMLLDGLATSAASAALIVRR